MGKLISHDSREHANNLLRDTIGMKDSQERFECVQRVSALLEQDRPHAAMKVAEEYIDTTGAYMLFAALLVSITETKKSEFLIYSNNSEVRYIKEFETSEDCRQWIINTLDLSMDWTFIKQKTKGN
jgi:hypothetical protein